VSHHLAFASCFQWFAIFTDYCERLSATELIESKLDFSLSKFSRSIPEALAAFGSLSVLKELLALVQSLPSGALRSVKEALVSTETRSMAQLVDPILALSTHPCF